MITEVILFHNKYADLGATVKSVAASAKGMKEAVQVLICNATGDKIEGVILSEVGNECKELKQELTSFAKQYKHIVKELQSMGAEYVHFVQAGDVVSKDAFSKIQERINEAKKGQVLTLQLPPNGSKVRTPRDTNSLDIDACPYDVPLALNQMVLPMPLLQSITLDEELEFFGEYELLDKVFAAKKTLLLTKGGKVTDKEDNICNEFLYSNSSKREWYDEFFESYAKPLIQKKAEECSKQADELLDLHIQYQLFFIISKMFIHNMNSRNKAAYQKDYDVLEKNVAFVLKYIKDEIIANVNDYFPYRLDTMCVVYLLKLKHGGEQCFQYATEGHKSNVYLAIGSILLTNILGEGVRLEKIESDEKEIRIECTTKVFTNEDSFKLRAKMNKKELQVEEIYRYGHIKFFGRTVDRRHVYLVHVPKEMLKSRAALAFIREFRGYEQVAAISTKRFTSHLNSEVESAYYICDRIMIDLRADKERMFFTPYTKKRHRVYEQRYMQELKAISQDLYELRKAYWLNYPKYHKKKIWITFDKLYKGGDCGEYFYKYAMTRRDGIQPEYLIKQESPDAARLVKEGYRPLYFGTMEHKLKFLYADVIVATHPNVPVYSALEPEEFEYMKDLFHARVVCIQHGLAVQKLALNLYQTYDNTTTFYAASKYEKKNLTHPIYGYKEEQIELTGIPRFDGLHNQDKRQILITPTWRSYIAMPPSIGSTRPYSPTFKETDYYKIYQSLINNKKLIESARKYNYKLIYLVHPTIASQIEDYTAEDVVTIQSPVGTSYEQLLTESSLMVTDYSGVQFDFAYMRKPIVYYHPDKLPPHYDEGGFFYDTMGFGEIEKEESALVDLLVGYMEKNCEMKEFYRKRADDFFAYADDKSCERIYESLLEKERT